jgi:RimJ/RimL family protein N-acetyltransferase
MRILVNYLLNEVGVEKIQAEVMPQNKYSKRVLEKTASQKKEQHAKNGQAKASSTSKYSVYLKNEK